MARDARGGCGRRAGASTRPDARRRPRPARRRGRRAPTAAHPGRRTAPPSTPAPHGRAPGPATGSSRDAAADLLRREELRRLRVPDRRVLATPRPYRGPDGERRQRTAVTSAGAGWPGPSGAPAELDHVLGEAL